MTSENRNHKTVNLSCRIDKIVYDQIAADAVKKGISINSLINGIAKHHVTWERHTDKIGFVPITKRMLKKIFKHLDDKTIKEIAELGSTVPQELLFLTYDKITFENLIQILEINALRFGAVNHIEIDGKHSINIHHGISKNFSHFLAYAHKSMAYDLSLKLTVTHIDKNMVCIEIDDLK